MQTVLISRFSPLHVSEPWTNQHCFKKILSPLRQQKLEILFIMLIYTDEKRLIVTFAVSQKIQDFFQNKQTIFFTFVWTKYFGVADTVVLIIISNTMAWRKLAIKLPFAKGRFVKVCGQSPRTLNWYLDIVY